MHKIKGRADHISSCKKWHVIYSITERNIAKIMTDDYSSICYLKQRINWYLDFTHWSQWQSGISILKCTCEGYPDQWKCAHIIVCLSMGCMACIYKDQNFSIAFSINLQNSLYFPPCNMRYFWKIAWKIWFMPHNIVVNCLFLEGHTMPVRSV